MGWGTGQFPASEAVATMGQLRLTGALTEGGEALHQNP